MRPSAPELIAAISKVLDERVRPTIEDRWAASTLTSIRCLLTHLEARVQSEAQTLWDDNADLHELLGDLRDRIPDRDLAHDVDAALAREWRPVGAFATVASMHEENTTLCELVDRLVRTERQTPAGMTDALDAYITRRLDRERPLYFPAFMGPMF